MTLHVPFEHRGAREHFPAINGEDRIPDSVTELVLYRTGAHRFTAIKRSYAGGQIVISRALVPSTARDLIQIARRAGHRVTLWGITP